MRVKFLDVGGIGTRILYEGTGYPLLLLHGLGALAEHWWYNIDELAKRFQVVAPDLIGHGFTDPAQFHGAPPHPKTVDHLAQLVDLLGFKKFAVCGSSYGALISCLLYFRMPDRVERLVICGSGSTFNSEKELASTLEQVYQNAMTAISNPSLESCRARMAKTCHDKSVVPDAALLAQLISYARSGMKEAYVDTIEGMMDQEKSRPYRVLERLEQIKIPTLLIWGREDPRGLYARAVENAPRFPNAKLVTFENCGHKPFMECPSEFHAVMQDFFADVQ